MLALDHIVISGLDIENASAQYGRQLSIKAIKGGVHDNWGTNNYLAYFSNDSYLEWLGVQDVTKASNTDNPLIQHLMHVLENDSTALPFQFALRTSELDQYILHFEKQGIPYKGPLQGQRIRPDGSMLKWRMLFPEYHYRKEMLPFLIEWDTPSNERIDTSLLNPQAITTVHYGGTSKENFAHIYLLKPSMLNKNQFPLKNAKISFKEQMGLDFIVE